MRLTRLVLALCLMMGSFGAAFSDTPAVAPAVTADPKLQALHDEFWDAFRARDLWRVSLMWDKDDPAISAAFPAAAAPAIGWGNIEETFRRSFSHNRDIKIDLRTIKTTVHGDVAWIISAVRFEAVQTQTGQYVKLDRMLTTEIYRRKGDGWMLVHYHGHYPGFLPPKDDPTAMLSAVTHPARVESDVWEAHDRFLAAFSARDLGAMLGLLCPETACSAIQPTSPVPFLGAQNVVASWKKTFDDIDAITIEPQRMTMDSSGSTAWITEAAQYHIVFKNSPDTIQHYHNVMTTYILVKDMGEWQIVHYHAHLGFSFEDHAH